MDFFYRLPKGRLGEPVGEGRPCLAEADGSQYAQGIKGAESSDVDSLDSSATNKRGSGAQVATVRKQISR